MSSWQGGFRNPIIHGNQIIEGTVDSGALADGAVITSKLADLAVEAGKLQDEAVENAKLGDGAVTTVKLQDLAVTTAKIGLLAVGSAQIADLAVTNAKIDSLSASKLTAGTIDTGDITVENKLITSSGVWVGKGTATDGNKNWSGITIKRSGGQSLTGMQYYAPDDRTWFYVNRNGKDSIIFDTDNDPALQITGTIAVNGDSGQSTRLNYIGTIGGIEFHGASGEDDHGYMYAINSEELQIAAPINDSGSFSGAILRMQSGNALGFKPGFMFGSHGAVSNSDWITIRDDGVTVDYGSQTIGNSNFNNGWIKLGTSSIGITIDSNEIYASDQMIFGTLNNNDIHVRTNGGDALEIFGNGRTWLHKPNTTTNSGLPAWRHDSFDASAPYEFLPLVSSEKFKANIRDISPQKARHYLRMYRPREWQSKASGDPKNVWLPGFVVEEMPKVPRDLTPALATLVTEHEKTIKDLEQRLAKLERTAKVGGR